MSSSILKKISLSTIIFKNDNLCVCFFILTDQNFSTERKQEASPAQEEGVRVSDASKQRHWEDGTAGASECWSERPQPPTEPLLSLPTVCVVSAAAPTLISHASHSLSHPLTCCLCRYQFLTSKYTRRAHATDTGAQTLSAHPHTFSSRQYMQGERNRN